MKTLFVLMDYRHPYNSKDALVTSRKNNLSEAQSLDRYAEAHGVDLINDQETDMQALSNELQVRVRYIKRPGKSKKVIFSETYEPGGKGPLIKDRMAKNRKSKEQKTRFSII